MGFVKPTFTFVVTPVMMEDCANLTDVTMCCYLSCHLKSQKLKLLFYVVFVEHFSKKSKVTQKERIVKQLLQDFRLVQIKTKGESETLRSF